MFGLKLHNVTNDQPLLPPYVLYRDELNLNGTTALLHPGLQTAWVTNFLILQLTMHWNYRNSYTWSRMMKLWLRFFLKERRFAFTWLLEYCIYLWKFWRNLWKSWFFMLCGMAGRYLMGAYCHQLLNLSIFWNCWVSLWACKSVMQLDLSWIRALHSWGGNVCSHFTTQL